MELTFSIFCTEYEGSWFLQSVSPRRLLYSYIWENLKSEASYAVDVDTSNAGAIWKALFSAY